MYSGKGYWTRMFIVAYDSVCGHEEGLGRFKEGYGGVYATSRPAFSASESRDRESACCEVSSPNNVKPRLRPALVACKVTYTATTKRWKGATVVKFVKLLMGVERDERRETRGNGKFLCGKFRASRTLTCL